MCLSSPTTHPLTPSHRLCPLGTISYHFRPLADSLIFSASEYRNHHSCRLAARPRQVYRQCCHVLAGINASPEGTNRAVGADACFDADGAHKNTALFDDTKVPQSSPESTCPQSRRLSVSNDVFIVLIYILYILTSVFYFVHWCARTQPLARRGQRTVALVHYGRERRAVGGSARRSAQAPTLHGKRA